MGLRLGLILLLFVYALIYNIYLFIILTFKVVIKYGLHILSHITCKEKWSLFDKRHIAPTYNFFILAPRRAMEYKLENKHAKYYAPHHIPSPNGNTI